MEQHSPGLDLEVGKSESGKLRAPHGGGEAEQDHGGVTGALGGGAVDAADDLADLLGPEGACLSAGCGADDAAQSPADLPDTLTEDRIVESVPAVLVGDGPEGADRDAFGGAFGEVGADHRRGGR